MYNLNISLLKVNYVFFTPMIAYDVITDFYAVSGI